MRLLVKIQRFNPGKSPVPQVKRYGVVVTESLTVLELLLKIKEETDGTLTFRCSCRSAICGSCAMEINGDEKLACKTQVLDEVKVHGELVIKPLKNTGIIKDLVVDMTVFWDEMRSLKPWVIKGPRSGKFSSDINVEETFNSSDNCIMCGACVAACSSKDVSPDFKGPAALAKQFRFLADPRDGVDENRLSDVDGENGIWDCVRCYYCQEVCPKHVKPVEAIVRSRSKAIDLGFDKTMGAKHINEFIKSVGDEGLVNETSLPLKMIGFDLPKLMNKMPLGLKMFVRGKMMPPVKKPLKGMKQIREIFNKIGRDEL